MTVPQMEMERTPCTRCGRPKWAASFAGCHRGVKVCRTCRRFGAALRTLTAKVERQRLQLATSRKALATEQAKYDKYLGEGRAA